jgi:quercetin dioxygenase-like cupin family protein
MQSPGRFFEHFGRSKMRWNEVMKGLRPPMATGGPVLEFDLPAAVMQLKHESNWSGHRNARTLVKHRDCRIVLMDLESGAHLVRHQTRGTVVIQVVSGHIKVRVFSEVFDVPVGHVISLDPHLSHDVEALEETALLITIAWPEDPGPCIVETVCAQASAQPLDSLCAITDRVVSDFAVESELPPRFSPGK